MSKPITLTQGFQNDQIDNLFITSQETIKTAFEISKQKPCVIEDSLFIQTSKQIEKQDSITYSNFANQNSQRMYVLQNIIQNNQNVLETGSTQDVQNVVNQYSLVFSDVEPVYTTNTNIIDKKGKISLSYIGYDILRAKNNLQIYSNDNNEKSSSKLNLNFQHNSYLLNAKNSDKKALEQAINYVYQGVNRAINALNNQNDQASKTIESLLCKTMASPDTMKNILLAFKEAMSAKTIYNFVQDTSLTKCKDTSYYPMYKDGSILNICPTYSNINLEQDCKNILQLTRLTKQEINNIDTNIISSFGPFVSEIAQNIEKIYQNQAVDANQVCANKNPYKSGNEIIHNLAKSIVVGIMTKEPMKILTSVSCQSMALNKCPTESDISSNNACFSDYIYANAILYQFENSIDYKININENCYAGCELSSPALNSLLGKVHSNLQPLFTTNDLLNTTLLPNLTISTTKSVKYNISSYSNNITSNESEVTVTKEMNVTNTEEISYFNNSAYVNIYDIITSYVVNFKNTNLSFISSLLKGSGFYEIRTQYFKMPDKKPYGLEMSLGKFNEINQLKSSAFNEYSLLVAFSTRQSSLDQYNIFVNVLTYNNSRILNVYPSIDGSFDIRAIQNSNDFIVSYKEDQNTLVTKKYTITTAKIVEKSNIKQSAQDNNFNTWISYISDVIKSKFNVIWNGYYKQIIDMSSSTTTIEEHKTINPINTVASSNQRSISVAVQNISHISVDTFNRDSNLPQSRHIFNITEWKLHDMQYINNDIAVLTLTDKNNTLQRLVLNTTNEDTLAKESYYYVGNEFVAYKIFEMFNNKSELFKQKAPTEFDGLISTLNQCEYPLSGKNHNSAFSSMLVKGNKGYLDAIQLEMLYKQGAILDEALKVQQSYNMIHLYEGLNLTSNYLVSIIQTEEGENFYGQVEGVAGAVEFLNNFSVSSFIPSDNLL